MPSGGRRHPPRSATCSILPRMAGARVVPYGGGTNVVGGLSPSELGPPTGGDPPILVVDLERMTGLAAYDESSGLATFGAGITGPALEAALETRGRTARPRAAIVGVLDARRLGRDPIVGPALARLRPDRGPVRRRPDRGTGRHPRAPAVPRLGCRPGPAPARPRVGGPARDRRRGDRANRARSPNTNGPVAWLIPDWERGMAAVRDLAEARLPLAMIRLSTPAETRTTLPWPAGDGGSGWPCAGPAGAAPATIRACSCSASPAGPGSPRRPAARRRRSSAAGGVRRPGRVRTAWDTNRFRGAISAQRAVGCRLRRRHARDRHRLEPAPRSSRPRSSRP